MQSNLAKIMFTRRSLLAGAAAGGMLSVLPKSGDAESLTVVPWAQEMGAIEANVRIPPVLRSRSALLSGKSAPTASALPLTQNGTTYNLAQEVRWLDVNHFAIGRWDGTMSIFHFNTAPYVGAQVTVAVNSPSAGGVQMITRLPQSSIVTSNDGSSLSVWNSYSGDWSDLKLVTAVSYDAALGVATNGTWFPGSPSTLVVGHDSGFLTMWSVDLDRWGFRLLKTLDVRNPNPVNPFGSHVIYGMCPLVASGSNATVISGSDDGYITIVKVPSGVILSQTVFNLTAQRGINSVSALGNKLLVSNCSVGAADHNLWYFDINQNTRVLTLLDSMNLIIDTQRVQSFNFDTIWGQYAGGPCWFAGTEEGALWMGTADTSLHLIGQQSLADGSIGAALAFTTGPGRLASVIHNIDQFTTGSS